MIYSKTLIDCHAPKPTRPYSLVPENCFEFWVRVHSNLKHDLQQDFNWLPRPQTHPSHIP